MPTYEYRCPLGHDFERFYRKISDATGEVRCPECGQIAERRLSAGAGLVFKGSGFYLTDYGKNAHRGAPAAEKGAEGAVNAKGEAGGEPKGTTANSGGGDSKPAADAKPAGDAKRAADQSGAATPRETPKSDAGGTGAQGGSKSKGEQKSESKPGPGKADH